MLTSLSVHLASCQSHSDLRTSSMLYVICKPNLNNRCKLEFNIYHYLLCNQIVS